MALRKPVVMVNFKTYPEACGGRAMYLGRACESVAQETGASIVIAPPMPDLSALAADLSISVFSQHADAVKAGSTTGHVPLEAVLASGAKGILLNHSECRMRVADIESLVAAAKGMELSTVVCTNNLGVTSACAALGPDFVAIEPPELIGGDVSVTTANPAIVGDAVTSVRRVAPAVGVLCGAGVKNGKDVAKAIELGTDGVLLASGVVKAKDPKAVLLDLVSGLP